jgi:hypothetical protein
MNLRLDNPSTFASEYQNRPLVKLATNSDVVSPEQIAKRTSAIQRLEIPSWCEIITTFIDIQDEVLFHATLACGTDYTGVITDYGTFPGIRRPSIFHQGPDRILGTAVAAVLRGDTLANSTDGCSSRAGG